MPPGFGDLEATLTLWFVAMIRPGAAFLAAPIFGAATVPVQLRLGIALGLAVPAMASGALVLPADGMLGVSGLLFVMSEALTGLALGFALQIGFAAAQIAGEAMSNAMGLGFAAMVDPVGGQMSPALGQLLAMLATFLFFAVDAHLAFIAAILDSYTVTAPGKDWIGFGAIEALWRFGSLMFAAGLSIALPVGFALILVQIAMGIVARSAPTLNLFAVGLPATLLAGVVLLAMALPALADTLLETIAQTLAFIRALGG